MSDETITVTVLREDAECFVRGPLDYAVAVSEGKVSGNGSPMRLRRVLAGALARLELREARDDS